VPASIWAAAVPTQRGTDNGNPENNTTARSTVAVLLDGLRFRMFEASVVNVPRRDRNELPFVVALNVGLRHGEAVSLNEALFKKCSPWLTYAFRKCGAAHRATMQSRFRSTLVRECVLSPDW